MVNDLEILFLLKLGVPLPPNKFRYRSCVANQSAAKTLFTGLAGTKTM